MMATVQPRAAALPLHRSGTGLEGCPAAQATADHQRQSRLRILHRLHLLAVCGWQCQAVESRQLVLVPWFTARGNVYSELPPAMWQVIQQ